MTLSCRNDNYNKISQILNGLLETYNKKVSIGTSCDCLQAKIVLFTDVKRVLCGYEPYLTDLTYLYSLTIAREGSASVTVDLDIGSDNFTYTGIDNAEGILLNLKSQLDASADFLTYLSGSTLYIYSYSSNLNFFTATTFTSSLTTTIGTLTNLEDKPNTLINLWNCLNSEEICNLVASVYELEPEC